jgi:hypothetical protein
VTETKTAKIRDLRLDFVRGLAMLIIIVAHTPSNPWNDWIPARFGFSSAAEMFVFCSGMASAMAFGSVFAKQGFGLGLMRIGQRIWQLYWAQVAVFIFTVALSVWATRTLGTGDYNARLYLEWFLTQPGEALLALLTLRYIPNFFDMLPMYMLLLAMVPVVMLVSRIGPVAGPAAVGIISLGLWLAIQISGFNLSARPDTDQVWFFNPLAWQLLFFTGFAFGMGWLKPPAFDNPLLFRLCATILIVSIPLSFWGFHQIFPALGEFHDWLLPDASPTQFSVLRLIHFISLAYLAVGLINRWQGEIATASALKPIIKVGQQTFAVFLVSVPLAWSMGMMLDVAGREPLTLTLVNMGGIATALAVAALTGWFKSQPWRRKPETKMVEIKPATAGPAPAESRRMAGQEEHSQSVPSRMMPSAS